MSYGLKLGWGGPIGGCIGSLGGTCKEYALTLVQGSYKGMNQRVSLDPQVAFNQGVRVSNVGSLRV